MQHPAKKKVQQETVVKKPRTVQNIDFSQIITVMTPTPWKLSVPPSCFVCEIRFLFCCAAHFFVFLLTMTFRMWRVSRRTAYTRERRTDLPYLGPEPAGGSWTTCLYKVSQSSQCRRSFNSCWINFAFLDLKFWLTVILWDGVCSLKAILHIIYTFLGLPSVWFVFEKTDIRIYCTQAPPTMGIVELVFFREAVWHVYIYLGKR